MAATAAEERKEKEAEPLVEERVRRPSELRLVCVSLAVFLVLISIFSFLICSWRHSFTRYYLLATYDSRSSAAFSLCRSP